VFHMQLSQFLTLSNHACMNMIFHSLTLKYC